MQHFYLEHPPDEVFLCDHDGCNGIADYLEVDGNQEILLCSVHTSSQTYAARLPSRSPSALIVHRSKPAM
jgi:hypothetical protein